MGATSRLTATPRAADGSALTGKAITWASGNLAIATVDQEGMVTAVAQGDIEVSATSEEKTGTASVTIVAQGSVERRWKGGAAGRATDWSAPANWEPAGKPTPLDLVRVPAVQNEVVLTEDVQVSRVIVAGGRVRITGHRLHLKGLPNP